ncbi:MAG TPA: ABC transporter permease, partial [Verrucomicrobiae bacterium]
MKKEFGIFILLVALCAVTSVLNPRFLSATNLTNMANIIGLFGIFSIGLGMVIITGGIDLSVGSIMGLVGVVCGVLLQAHSHWAVALAAGLLTGMAAGVINGALIAYVGLSPFVVTLGML